MPELTAQRTLVKSPPELWAQLSDPASLSRHLGEFGEIRITRVVPEQTVAWEGERASGTVELSASGWGTKVTLRARLSSDAAPVSEPEPEPASEPEPTAAAEAPGAEPEPAGAFQLLNSLAREPLPRASEADSVDEPVAAEDDAPESAREADPEPQGGPEPDAWFSQSPDRNDNGPGWPAPKTAAGIAQQRNGLFARLFGKRTGTITAAAPPTPASEIAPPEPEAAPMIADEPESAVEPTPEPAPEMTETEREPHPEPAPIATEPESGAEDLAPAPEADDPAPAASRDPVASLDPVRAEAVLSAVLDDLGAARHRPFSRG